MRFASAVVQVATLAGISFLLWAEARCSGIERISIRPWREAKGAPDKGAAEPTPCCHTVMKTMTRTVYENVCETREKVVYDTVWEQKTVEEVQRVPRTEYRQEEFTYQRPVYDTVTREVPCVVTRPVWETRTREITCVRFVPSYETRTYSVPFTVYQKVEERGTRTVSYCVPRTVCYTKTIEVPSGRWETRMVEDPYLGKGHCVQKPDGGKADCTDAVQKGRDPVCVCRRVWVPCTETREITCRKTVYDRCTVEVPYVHCRVVPQTCTRDVQCTVCRMVPVRETRTIDYPVCKVVSEQQSKTVCQTVTRMVPEVGTRNVPYTTYQEVPVCRTVMVPRQVPRRVTFTVTRCVPRTETFQVPVRVCDPPAKEGKGPDGGKDTPGQGLVPLTPSMDETEANGHPGPPRELADELAGHRTTAHARLSSQDGEPAGTSAAPQLLPLYAATVAPGQENGPASAFAGGLEHYRHGRYDQAAGEFQTAMEAAPENARYAYYCAVALHEAGRQAEAAKALSRAVEAERQCPVPNWGQAMERIQGQARLWLDEARKAARATY